MGKENTNDRGGNEVRFYLIDRNRTTYIGPFFSELEVRTHLETETGMVDFQKALKFMGLELVQTVTEVKS